MLFELIAAVPGVPDDHDYITTGGAVLIALITTVGTVLAAQGYSTRKVLNTTAENTKKAVQLGAPTGNGFAAEVRAALGRIERDIEGIRSENRTERQERIMLAQTVSKLIERKG